MLFKGTNVMQFKLIALALASAVAPVFSKAIRNDQFIITNF